MFRKLYTYYWQVGFKTRLYDVLAPEVYIQSLKRCADSIPLPVNVLLDAGCGSGLGFNFLRERIHRNGVYIGLDILEDGLRSLIPLANAGNFSGKVFPVKSDLATPLPLKQGIADAVMAHFSIYTLENREHRMNAWKQLYGVLKPGGRLSASNPSVKFDPSKIIASSLEVLNQSKGSRVLAYRYLLYPLTRILGLNHIERQLRSGTWKAYSEDDFIGEVIEAGFEVESVESVYADSGIHLVAIKKYSWKNQVI